ncbi:EamA family transporter [Agarivorans aestuarii]|uniref:EamA family transporter n=1 Tax=Agarivorans aestuarii TaxID=1563703 RepID=A0ABU7G4K9_9ALTE|nr:EamA family transporter [Agarivorans aestuarii]MEE1674251.1 EamA family transporter [Agarivorans aestuarii]
MKFVDILFALIVATIWGVNFSVIKWGLTELPPVLFSALRFAIVAIPAVFFVPFPKTALRNVVAVGVSLGVIKFSLLFVAMEVGASAGLSSLLLQAQVMFTILLSVIWFKEKITIYQFAGIGLSSLGFALFFALSSENLSLISLLLLLLAALSWAVSNMFMKQAKGVNVLHFMVWVSLIPPLPLLAFSYLFETQTPYQLLSSAQASTWLALAYVGFISTLLAFALWGHLLAKYSAAAVTPFALLVPIVGMVTANVVFDESLNRLEWAGAALVLLGLISCVFGQNLQKYLTEFFSK